MKTEAWRDHLRSHIGKWQSKAFSSLETVTQVEASYVARITRVLSLGAQTLASAPKGQAPCILDDSCPSGRGILGSGAISSGASPYVRPPQNGSSNGRPPSLVFWHFRPRLPAPAP